MWNYYTEISIAAGATWLLAIILYLVPNPNAKKAANFLSIVGVLIFGFFIAKLWINLERPPLRTLGETRLWYILFLPIIGIVAYFRWKYSWIIIYSLFMSLVFLGVNLAHPENYDKSLMPALQSPWFVPHVIVYIFSYAMLAASSIVALKGLIERFIQKKEVTVLNMADNFVYIGFGFLTLGLIFGGLWAKEAWGHYWTWDPKETWALITWLGYMMYIHIRQYLPKMVNTHLTVLSISFVLLLICWFGLNYMSSGAASVHTYSN